MSNSNFLPLQMDDAAQYYISMFFLGASAPLRLSNCRF